MLEIDVRRLLASPGTSRQVSLEEPQLDLATELATAVGDPPIRVEVLLESVVEGIFVSGTVAGRMRMLCARCLEPFDRDFGVPVGELFVSEPAEDEGYPLGEGVLDLAPLVRDSVLLEMPFAPLCRDECRGLCERCGGNRNRDECSCAPRVDPRWAGLEQLNLD